MPRRRSPRRSPARTLVLALLAWAMALAPALSFAAEAHEAIGHPAALGCDHEAGRHDQADEEHGDDGARMLHLVTQLGICCGHACALPPASPTLAARATPAQPDVRIGALAPGRAPEDPLRPPIAA